MTTGIILFAHGSRDADWCRPIEAVAAAIRMRQPHARVSCAYLELMAPDLPSAAQDLMAQGATGLRIFPLFLGVGRHAREDLPRLVEALRSQYPAMPVELMAAAGEDARLVLLLADIALA